MKIDTNITIQAPIETVFTVFTDLSRIEERVAGIQKIEILEGSAQMKVGTKWKETRKMFGKEATETMWVTELASQKSYAVEAESCGTKYRSEYTFTDTEGGTYIEMTFAGTPQTFAAKILSILFCFMAGATKKMLRKDMEDLKGVCEQ